MLALLAVGTIRNLEPVLSDFILNVHSNLFGSVKLRLLSITVKWSPVLPVWVISLVLAYSASVIWSVSVCRLPFLA